MDFPAEPRKGVRLWPVVIILLITAAQIVYAWWILESDRQFRILLTAQAIVLFVLLMILWLALLSRIPWPRRTFLLVGVLGLLGVSAFLFEFQAVTGDFIPIFAWRFADKPGAGLDSESPATAVRVSLERTEDDYPAFLGGDRNATFPDKQLDPDWKANPPRELWRRPVGPAWSSFAVVGEIAVTQEQRGEAEAVVAYSLLDGELLWIDTETARYANPIGGTGPRATPTLQDGKVYALGATGRLLCLDLATGKRLFTRDVLADTGRGPLDWGVSCSPLVLDEVVVVTSGSHPTVGEGGDGAAAATPTPAGGKDALLIAYDRETGEIAWSAGRDAAGYSSPRRVTLDDVPQILIFNHSSVSGHSPEDGELIWSFGWSAQQPNVAQPVVTSRNHVLVSSGYGIGSRLLKLQKSDDRLVVDLTWETPRLRAKFCNIVVRDGFAYGLDDGILACLDLSNGQRAWKGGRYGHGQLLLVGEHLLVQSEDGDLVLVAADPGGHDEVARHPALTGKTWNHPALVGSRLLVRNDREAICFELTLR